jgi:hypothetical protein
MKLLQSKQELVLENMLLDRQLFVLDRRVKRPTVSQRNRRTFALQTNLQC